MSRVAIASRIRNAHPDHQAIGRGMLVGAAFIFVSKLAGAAKEMAIAWRYGVSEVVDAYLFIFNLMNWPVAVWFAVLVVVLVPLAATIRERAPHELPRFRREMLGLTLVLGLFLTLFAEICLPLFLRSSLGGLSGSALAEALNITPVLCCLILFGMPVSLLSAWTTSAGRYVNTLLEGVPALTIFVVLLLSSGSGSAPLVLGTVAGLMLQLIALSVSLISRDELEVPPLLSLQSPYWSAFWRGFGMMLIGQALLSLSTIVDQFFAARLPSGAIATLSYANRIVALILGLGATAVSRATLPVFSKARATGSQDVGHVATRWAQLLFGLGLIAVGVGWWFAPWSVRILFERGAFTAHDTQAVTQVLRYALVQIPFYISALVFVSFVSSSHGYGTLSLLGFISLVVKVVGNSALVSWMGLNGLVLTNTLVYGVNLTVLAVAMKLGKLQNTTPEIHAL